MQNKSLRWRGFCELVGDTGIYSSQVSSFAGGYRYLYGSIYKIGKCPRSCLFPGKLDHVLRVKGSPGKFANRQRCRTRETNTKAHQPMPIPNHKELSYWGEHGYL